MINANPKEEVAVQIDITGKAFSGRLIYFRNLYKDYPKDGDALDMAIFTTIKKRFSKANGRIRLVLFYESVDHLRSQISQYRFRHQLKVNDRVITLFYHCNQKDLIFVQKSLEGLNQIPTSNIAESLIESLSDITSYKRN